MFTKTDLAAFYDRSLPTLRRYIRDSGLGAKLPKLTSGHAVIFAADMPVIEEYLGPCPGWRRYLRGKN